VKKLLQTVSLAQLSDGYAGRVIDEALQEAHKDLYQRGSDGKPRKVVITITLQPEANNQVDIDVQAKTAFPPMRPPSTKAKLDMNAGGLIFNPDCADNPDQMTIPLDGTAG
jgi:hypothetical protein